MKPPPGFDNKIMNAAFRIGDTDLMADDGMAEKPAEFKEMTRAIGVADDAEASPRLHGTRPRREGHHALYEDFLDLFFWHADRQVRRAVDGERRSIKGVSQEPP